MERDEFLRAAWRVMVAEGLDARRLVFVDEMGTNASLSPLYAWSRKDERARWSVLRNRGKNTTLSASMNVKGIDLCARRCLAAPQPPSSKRTWSECSFRV